jgi:hypothetical protein
MQPQPADNLSEGRNWLGRQVQDRLIGEVTVLYGAYNDLNKEVIRISGTEDLSIHWF